MVIKYLKQTITGRSSPKNKRLIILSSPGDDIKSVVVSQSTEQFWSFTVKQHRSVLLNDCSSRRLDVKQEQHQMSLCGSSADAPRYRTGCKKTFNVLQVQLNFCTSDGVCANAFSSSSEELILNKRPGLRCTDPIYYSLHFKPSLQLLQLFRRMLHLSFLG